MSSPVCPSVESRALRLLEGAARLAEASTESVLALAEALLAVPSDDWRQARSGLNYDNSPIQLCLGASAKGSSYRLLVDPACTTVNLYERYRRSLSALEQGIALTGVADLAPILHQTLRANLPDDPGDERSFDLYPDGVLWLGAAIQRPGLAMYVDARRGGPDAAHQRLSAWMRGFAGDTSDVSALLAALHGSSALMCLGIEGIGPKMARAKVYWRLSEARELSSLGLWGFGSLQMNRFLRLFSDARTMRLSGVVLSAGIDITSGCLADVKVDLCACRSCLHDTPDNTAALCDRITTAFDLSPLPIRDALEYGELAFFGFGLDVDQRCRLNLYVKPFPL